MTGSEVNLDWLISVDDHVLEPPHLWIERVAAQGPGACPAHGGRRRRARLLGVRRQALPQLGAQRRGRKIQGGIQPGAVALPRDATGLLRPQGPHRRHGSSRHPRIAVLPHAPTLLRTAVHGRQRPRVRVRLPPGLQRLDDRGVVRERSRPVHPARADPHVGSAAGRQGARTLRRQGSQHVRLLREPGAARPADDPRPGPLLGSGVRRRQRAGDGGVHPRGLVVPGPSDRARRTLYGEPHLGCHAHVGDHALVAVQRHVHPFPKPEGRPLRGRDRLDPVLPRACRAGARQAAVLGPARTAVHGARHHRRRPGHDRRARALPRPHLRLLHRRRPRHREHRRDRRGQHHVRDGLSALGLHVAKLHPGGQAPHRSSSRGDAVQAAPGNAERLYRFTPADPPLRAGRASA